MILGHEAFFCPRFSVPLFCPGLMYHRGRNETKGRKRAAPPFFPVRAKLVADAPDWRALLISAVRKEELRDLREHGRTVRPLASATFIERLEGLVGRPLRPRTRSRKPKLPKPRK